MKKISEEVYRVLLSIISAILSTGCLFLLKRQFVFIFNNISVGMCWLTVFLLFFALLKIITRFDVKFKEDWPEIIPDACNGEKQTEENYEILPLGTMVLGIIGTVLFSFPLVTMMLFAMDQFTGEHAGLYYFFVIFFLSFMLLSLYLYLYCQKIIITRESIGIKKLGKYCFIRYEEIEYFEECGGNINIGTKTEQISLPSYSYWYGKYKLKAFNLLIYFSRVEKRYCSSGMIPFIKWYKIYYKTDQ